MAVKKSKITEKIKNNTLVTDGIYSYVRNPIYSAFMIVEWGILLILGNPLLGIAIPLYWGLMTIMVKKTEEKWLLELYGDSFKEYCTSVNRCIPWIKKK